MFIKLFKSSCGVLLGSCFIYPLFVTLNSTIVLLLIKLLSHVFCCGKPFNRLFISSDKIIILFPNIVAGTKNTKIFSTQENGLFLGLTSTI